MLEVIHVTKKYGKTYANNDLNFSLDEGTITVLLGPNGAGKSTIIKSIIGFLKYDGTITIGGHPNKSLEAKRLIGYIPELPALYPNLTVREHLEFVARAYKLKDYKQRIDDLLAIFELTENQKKFGDELSKGMQQKLNICIGLLPGPQVVLLDEPMIGLDPHAIKELKDLLEKMKQDGKTVLVSTHMIDSVDMLWDRALIMQKGEIKANITNEDIASSGKSLEEQFFAITEGKENDTEDVTDEDVIEDTVEEETNNEQTITEEKHEGDSL